MHDLTNNIMISAMDFITETDKEVLFIEYKNASIEGAVNPNGMLEKIKGEDFYKKIARKYYDSLLLFWDYKGYPFLVSKICQIIDEQILGANKRIWTLEDIDSAMKYILKGTSTLFDDLIKNIENNTDIHNLIERIILSGDEIIYKMGDYVLVN